MKKIFLMLFVASLLSVASEKAFAQYEKGDKLLNVGLGLGSYYGGGVAVGASFEYGVTDFISVGAQADFYTWGYNWDRVTNTVTLSFQLPPEDLITLVNTSWKSTNWIFTEAQHWVTIFPATLLTLLMVVFMTTLTAAKFFSVYLVEVNTISNQTWPHLPKLDTT